MLTPETLRTLRTPSGEALLRAVAAADLSEANTLRLLTHLRRAVPAPLAEAALETARLRLKAAAKFGPDAATMFFTREALEQATDGRISAARAAALGFDATRTLEFGCGIGGDTRTWARLAGSGGQVIAFELDPLRAAMARANVPDAHVAVCVADLQGALPLHAPIGPGWFGFFDPARRSDDRRTFSAHHYVPALGSIRGWHREARVIERFAIKLAPGIAYDELHAILPEYVATGRLCFFSLAGELKEATLIFSGEGAGHPTREAWVVGADGHADALRRAVAGMVTGLDVRAPAGWLYEPDPAVIRAGLVQDLGALLDAAQIDPTIAFLSADQAVETPFARCWPILDWMPFNLKRLRAWLRERGIGRVVVKKRGSPITPEDLIAKLRLDGEGDSAVVVLTHVQGAPAVILCGER